MRRCSRRWRGTPRSTTDADDAELTRRFPQLVEDPYELPEFVPEDVAKLVYACLQTRPEDRPTPAELADALGPILDRHPRGRLAGFRTALNHRPSW